MRVIMAFLATIVLGLTPVGQVLAAGDGGEAYRPAPQRFTLGDASFTFPLTPGPRLCAPAGDYQAMAESMRKEFSYALVLVGCEGMAGHGAPDPILAIGDLSKVMGPVLSRTELFKELEGYPQSAWNEGIQAGADEADRDAKARHLDSAGYQVDMGFNKAGHDGSAFYLSGLMLGQEKGEETVTAAAIAISTLHGRAFTVVYVRLGDKPQDVERALAELKAIMAVLAPPNTV